MELLDEMEILRKKEIAEETFQVTKQFWSLCCNQQLVVAPMQTHGQWLPVLLEIVTSLASVYIDLFVVSYEHAENQTLWSKRLYSWLKFDLNQRAIKTAFLEVSCPTQKASKLLSPILSKIFASPLDAKSHMDYLLHMLLLKKWSKLCDEAVFETSRTMKGPKKFILWLCGQWKDCQKYIPQDKSLKGTRITEFILDLDSEAIESLIDMFSDCLKGKNDAVGISDSTELVEERHTAEDFIVDKKGSGHSTQDIEILPKPKASSDALRRNGEAPWPSYVLDTKGSENVMRVSDSEDEVQFIRKNNEITPKRQKRKCESVVLDPAEELNYYIIPDCTPDGGSSPKKKKQQTGTRDEESNDVMVIDSSKSSEGTFENDESHDEVQILNDGDEHGEDYDNPFNLDVTDLESLTDLVESTEELTSRVRIKKHGAKSIPRQNTFNRKQDTILKTSRSVPEDITQVPDDEEVVELCTRSKQVDNGESDIVEIVVEPSQSGKERERRMEANFTKSKPLIPSNPISSCFAPEKDAENRDKIQILDLAKDPVEDHRVMDIEVTHFEEKKISNENLTRLPRNEPQKMPKHRLRSSDKDSLHHGSSKEKQTFTAVADDSVGENFDEAKNSRSVMTLSEDDENGSDWTSSNKFLSGNVIVIPEDSTDGNSTRKKDLDVNVIVPSLEEDLSRQLNSIRKSVSNTSQSRAHSEFSGSISPCRKSTRIRKRLEGKASGPNQTQHQVMSEKEYWNEKMTMEVVSSASNSKSWSTSPPRKLSGGVVKRQTSPLKLAEKNFGVGIIKGEQSPKASASIEEKKQNFKSPVKNKPPKFSSLIGSEEKRVPGTKSEIFQPTYSKIKTKYPSSQKSSSSSNNSSSEYPDISNDASSYNLRTPRKPNPPKSPKEKMSSGKKRYCQSQKTIPSDVEFKTSPAKGPRDKLNKSGTDDKKAVSTSLTRRKVSQTCKQK